MPVLLSSAAGCGEGSRHLLAALDHAHGAVLGQVEACAKTSEIPLFTTLLDRIEISDAVVTADAFALRKCCTHTMFHCRAQI